MNTTYFNRLSPDLIIAAPYPAMGPVDWQERIEVARSYVEDAKAKGYSQIRRLIVSMNGVVLTTEQRQDLDHVFRDNGIACVTALMTGSAAARAMFLVTLWASKNDIHVFSLDDMGGVAHYLKLNAGEAFAARQELAKLGHVKKSA